MVSSIIEQLLIIEPMTNLPPVNEETNDQEPPPDALDFSDDEKEKEAKQRKKSQVQGQKKFKSEFNESGAGFAEVHQNGNARSSASEQSKGYCNREFTGGFSQGRYPQPCPGRPPSPQVYNSEHMVSQESSGFPPQRQENRLMPQYPFPPPVFDMHNFSLPPPHHFHLYHLRLTHETWVGLHLIHYPTYHTPYPHPLLLPQWSHPHLLKKIPLILDLII
ncbi:hypothetical protein MC885_013415, partial [Smutsia gigantea]